MFEWAWQNPHISRQMPQAAKQVLHRTRKDRDTSPGQRRRGGKGNNRRLRPSLTMAGKLANMHSMLTLDAWKRWPLKVKVFSEDVWNTWSTYTNKKGVPPLPDWITVELDLQKECLTMLPSETEIQAENSCLHASPSVSEAPKGTKKAKIPKQVSSKKESPVKSAPTTGGVPNLDLLDGSLRDLQLNKLTQIDNMGASHLDCGLCLRQIDAIDQRGLLACSAITCNHVAHVSCMAKHFLLPDQDLLLPTHGNCPSCGTVLAWGDLVKGAHFRHLLRTTGGVEEDEDEFADLEMDGQSSNSDTTELSSDDEPLVKQVKNKRAVRTRSKSPRIINPGVGSHDLTDTDTKTGNHLAKARKGSMINLSQRLSNDEAPHQIVVID